MKKLIISLIATLALSMSVASNATLLSVELDGSGSYEVGDTITANIIISDIEQIFGVNNVVGSFEFSLLFDDALMSFDSGIFGSGLDVVPLDPSEQDITVFGNEIMISELSYGFFDELETAQSDEFLLSSISFIASAAGNAGLSLDNILLSDDIGSPSSFNSIDSQGASLNISADPQAIPEPSMLWLFGGCLMAFAGLRRRVS